MTTLESYQRGLLDLVKSRGPAPIDPYLRAVGNSSGIAVVREIAVWWRAFQIASECPLVSLLLRYHGCFDATIREYFTSNRTSPFVEELTDHFLAFLGGHADPFLRSTAAFERALLSVRAGTAKNFEIYFDRDPNLALEALHKAGTLPSAEPEFRYRMTVAAHLPNQFCCTRENIDGQAGRD